MPRKGKAKVFCINKGRSETMGKEYAIGREFRMNWKGHRKRPSRIREWPFSMGELESADHIAHCFAIPKNGILLNANAEWIKNGCNGKKEFHFNAPFQWKWIRANSFPSSIPQCIPGHEGFRMQWELDWNWNHPKQCIPPFLAFEIPEAFQWVHSRSFQFPFQRNRSNGYFYYTGNGLRRPPGVLYESESVLIRCRQPVMTDAAKGCVLCDATMNPSNECQCGKGMQMRKGMRCDDQRLNDANRNEMRNSFQMPSCGWIQKEREMHKRMEMQNEMRNEI